MSKQITKSYLEYLGITDVSKDGKVFTKQGEIVPRDNGKGYKKMGFTGKRENAKAHDIYIHQIVYAWYHGEIPYGHTVHHRDLNRSNNSLDNLLACTPEEHKRIHYELRSGIREEKCRLDIPREHYVKKIKQYEDEGKYSNASQYKRRLKYYDNHIAEYEKLLKLKKDIEILKYLKREAKKAGNLRQWHQFINLEKNWISYTDTVREQIMKHILKE